MRVFVWVLIYGVPLIILGFVVSIVLKRYEEDRRRISSWLAITFTGLSALGGVWGLIILDQLSRRDRFDYGYERRCFFLALLGGLSALAWVIRSRKMPSFLTLEPHSGLA
jgi:MFS family permease